MTDARHAPDDPDAATVAVRCSKLTHDYGATAGSDRSVTALRNVSLEIRANEITALTGPSGSGKSTLLHALAGLLTPTEGTIEFDDTDLTDLSDAERTRLRRREIGFVFQSFHLLPALTARANVALPLVPLGYAKADRRDRATKLLAQVDLGDRATHKPAELSGGERQRVAIARALATEPELVLADEPTGELDTETGQQILNRLAAVADDRTVVLATHDERALEVADRVVRLVDGTVTDDGR
ncbi:ABC transporter ATP-binding protein [Natronolimnohabitans innermongolicus]|uniref:ABC transporter-related protein n=1 Tax=Natronolimnohabitans innermongolicus JCM 12255 TaxID=1227499 RepID=L9XHQ8_9EURY|nr:ABC transporter ATP-binding protein [Natronolimnohabitans innermongolicus]ELY61137.1 ABC transporter-related protein [Natronolimnohabitans innermongolicus JCM 12255]